MGAALDRDAENVLAPLVAAVQRARAKIEAESKKTAAGLAAETKKGTRAAAASFDDFATQVDTKTSRILTPYRDATAKFASDTRTHLDAAKRDFTDFTRSAERDLERLRKAEQDDTSGRRSRRRRRGGGDDARGGGGGDGAGGGEGQPPAPGGRRRGSLARGLTVAGAAYATRSAYRFASRVAGDFARGAGVDWDLSSLIQKNVELETRTTDLSNQAYMPGKAGPAGERQDPRVLAAEVRRVAQNTGTDTTTAVEGLQAFVAKTGDLALARQIFERLAILSKATGTNLADMVDAAGDVSNQLGDIPGKAQAINNVMTQVASQGKEGAVEIRSLASQMAKVAAMSGQIEGDTGENIKVLTAFAQAARGKGGAASAEQAATAVQSFIKTFKTPARARAFEAATGKSVFNAQGMLRNPEELVIEALKAKGMKPLEFNKIFANVRGASAVEGFASIYRQAGGGEAGEREVREAFDRFRKAAMDDEEILESFRAAMATSESQTTNFNTQLQRVVGETQDALLPAFIALTPTIIAAAESLGKVAAALWGLDTNKTTDPAYYGADKASRDIRRTESQIQRGFIDPRQVEKNQRDEESLRKAIAAERAAIAADKAKSDYGVSEGKSDSAVGAAAMKDFLIGTIGGLSEWRLDGGMRYINMKRQDVQQREGLIKSDEERLSKLTIENARVHELLKSGVINVRVVGVDRPPGADGSGVARPEAQIGSH
ncbi:phage tail tape measure protein [Pendulispora brunnea]|uniref:Phage tail tape measure protein n=1 Tax=Pendulispora brunnea TaxID=2905690 RepID=A0ABZ2KHJ5_9BACT